MIDRKNVKVWTCKVVVSGDAELPPGFDSPPRRACIKAVEDAGIEVLGCSSGWHGSISQMEEEAFNSLAGDTYYAGTLDSQEGGAH